MMRKILILIIAGINSSFSFSQTLLTIEGTTTINTTTGEWSGYNIPRSVPTTLIYRNNSITSENASGYILQAGDEVSSLTNNNLKGAIITGNKFVWNGTDGTSITHGVFTGYNINSVIKYNYLNKVPMSIIRKSNGMTNTSGGVAYNIINKTQAVGIVVKGMNGVNIYNNTLYSDQVRYSGPGVGTWRGLVDIYTNTDITPNAASTGTKIKNNIFYTKHQICNIYIYEAACLTGFESDYNVFYCEEGTPMFKYLGTELTFAKWQALGYDLHSVVINPNFKDLINFVPTVRLDYGTNLGAVWQSGLSVNAIWGTTDPANTDQNGTWQVGARIYNLPVSSINVISAGGLNTIITDDGTLQLNAEVLPANASNKTVTWSIINGTGLSTITSSGLVTAVKNGTVTAVATANDGSGISGSMVIAISNQVVPVTTITVKSELGTNKITTENGTLQLYSEVTPIYATDKSVTWSIIDGTGQASINAGGLVTAISDGTVTAIATSNDGTGVFGSLTIANSKNITTINVTGEGGANTIAIDNGTLQLNAAILPENASNKAVTWSIINGTGQGTISPAGLVTAVDNGTVTAKATANDGSDVTGSLTITNSNQIVPVTGITISGKDSATFITTDSGTLQLSAEVLPVNASNKTYTWSIIEGTNLASINSSGLISAVDNGVITIRAIANDGSGVFDTFIVTISNQVIPVESIGITSIGGANSITTGNGTLQLSATISPANATNKSINWSIVNGTGRARINSTGLVTAIDNGTVTAIATATDGSGVSGNFVITNSNQLVHVLSITVTGNSGATAITDNKGTLQLSATVLPANAADKTISWSIVNGTGQATISTSGLVAAVDNGFVTAVATANDGSGVFGTLVITNSNQIIPVTNITVGGLGGVSTISSDNGVLQLNAAILPLNATNKSLTWSITSGEGLATINSSGLVTAIENGTITAQATANDGTNVFGNMIITVSDQIIPVTAISVTWAGESANITSDNGTVQMSASVLPANATDKTITWSLAGGTGIATISSSGLVQALDNGIISVTATANDGSGISGSIPITITNQLVPVKIITISGEDGKTRIDTDKGTLQLTADVLPYNSTDRTVTWSLINDTGQATINSSGLVTAKDNGTVTAIATSNDGSAVFGILIITISNQVQLVTNISVTGLAGSSSITIDDGSLQLNTTVLPSDAKDNSVTWSIVSGTGLASIDSNGIVSAIDNGIVIVNATANDGSGIFGAIAITISNQYVPVSGITITGAGGETSITTEGGTLQLNAVVSPDNVIDKEVTWSIINGSGRAYISSTGLLTAMDNGTVTAVATSKDGSGVFNTISIDISNQKIPVEGIIITSEGGVSTINTDLLTLQLIASVLPLNATEKNVTWTIDNRTGKAAISNSGLVTAVENGIVTARATANDGSGIYDTFDITISSDYTNPDTGENGRIKVVMTKNEMKILLINNTILWKVGVFNSKGCMVLSDFIASDLKNFNISSLPSEIYIIVLSRGDKIKIAKVIKP